MKTFRVLKIFQYIFILVLPFFLLFWLNPLFLGEYTIGNDYSVFHIDHQMEIQYSLEHGSFPLFIPGFAGGRSSSALTLGQLYHPLPHLSRLLPTYWTGGALDANTIWRLISLGISQLIVFILLGRLKLRPTFAFIISFITIYNLRMLDLFRYGASLENYLAFIWLCAFMAVYYIRPTKVLGPTSVIVSTYMLICGGHPQMMYLGLLGAGMVCLLLPHSLAAISSDVDVSWSRALKFYRNMAICVIAGLFLASAYILPFYFEFIGENATRVGRDYRWSLAYADSWGGILNSYFRPLYSVVNSTFGSSSVIVLTLFLPLSYLFRRQVPKVIIFLCLAFALVFFCGLGDQTPVHFLFWKYFPLANVFRTPGRINMILPFLILLIMAWQLKSTDEWSEMRQRWMKIPPVLFLVILSFGLFVLYNTIIVKIVPEPTWYIPYRIKAYPGWVDTYAYVAGIVTLVLLALYIAVPRIKPVFGVLLCAAVIFQIGLQMRYGTWLIPQREKPTLEQMDRQKARGLVFRSLPGYGMESTTIDRQIRNSALDPKVAQFYRRYVVVGSEDAVFNYLAKSRKPTEAVVETDKRSKLHPRCDSHNPACGVDRIEMLESSYNRVLFSLNATEDGLFTLHFPFSKRWSAIVDGESSEVYRANGHLLSVFIPKGEHKIEFRYWSPASFAGILISLLTALVVAVWFIFSFPGRKRRIIFLVGAVLFVSGVFFAWYNSLYSGDNLGTVYNWRSNTFPSDENLAFGRKTRMSSIRSIERPYSFYAGMGVDGEKASAGFVTANHLSYGWWEVDLGETKEIDRMVIYDAPTRTRRNYLPIKVMISEDGLSYREILTLSERPAQRTWTIPIGGAEARFVRLRSSAVKVSFSFFEVEIYGND